ncbi:stearoyl-CoA 9-desaturase [Streptomyces sp. B1I3]|uniref:stearoyl-CoA 9-desaturase n=1 Tax=Streptomyces sp. B1I3 TaxID=3042264 RepID=UPI002784A22D|nr:stearoyl-CoA 9-desaturase [Streptomyces sp. B1I3]MDQ0795639.1 fatty acid desaturase [Streptomyces sp. B1I3]
MSAPALPAPTGGGAGAAEAGSAPDPRESMRVLPRFTQYPLTLLTGKPLKGQAPPHRWTPGFHLGAAALSMVSGSAVSAVGWALSGAWLLLLLPGWAVTLHGMRNLRMMVYHQCSHRNMFRRRTLDAAIGRAVSGLLIIQHFSRYSEEHVSDHHAAHHMTLRDPTVQAFLISLDLHPGMTRSRMWQRILAKLFSPVFHATFAVARVRSFWHGSSRSERLTALALYGGGGAAGVVTGTWPALLAVWFVPLVPLFQISNTLRLCVKHTFPDPDLTERRGKAYFGSLTNAIFIGEAVPAAGLPPVRRAAAWLRWTLRLVCVHFPARYLVLTGDTVVHDFHHRHPATREWADYLFARQADEDRGSPGWPPYHHAWGFVPAVNLVLDSLSAADATEFDVRRVRDVSRRELFAAFDD